jgi:hypothetical protein
MRVGIRTAVVLALVAIGVAVAAPPARAVPAGSFTSAHGSISFDLTGSTLTKTVSNVDNSITVLNDVITGFQITFSTSETVALTSGTAPGTATCTGPAGSVTCTTSNVAVNPLASPFDWAVVATGGTTETLEAGSGALHPGGIVNASIVTNPGDGLGNAQHNPFLLGPVTFVQTLSNPNVTITGVTFLLGTEGIPETGRPPGVPEPATLLLLGFALAGVAGAARWRHRSSD